MRLFPDFPWLQGTYFTLKCRAQPGNKIQAHIWFAEKVHLNHGWNLVHFSQSKIPWLSLTLNKIPWLSRRNFFPWFSLMLRTLSKSHSLEMTSRKGLVLLTPLIIKVSSKTPGRQICMCFQSISDSVHSFIGIQFHAQFIPIVCFTSATVMVIMYFLISPLLEVFQWRLWWGSSLRCLHNSCGHLPTAWYYPAESLCINNCNTENKAKKDSVFNWNIVSSQINRKNATWCWSKPICQHH